MLCGTPVIAFNKGSMPELINDKINGFLVNSVHEAAESVKLINTISRAECRKWAESKFSMQQMVAGYEQVYKNILDQKLI